MPVAAKKKQRKSLHIIDAAVSASVFQTVKGFQRLPCGALDLRVWFWKRKERVDLKEEFGQDRLLQCQNPLLPLYWKIRGIGYREITQVRSCRKPCSGCSSDGMVSLQFTIQSFAYIIGNHHPQSLSCSYHFATILLPLIHKASVFSDQRRRHPVAKILQVEKPALGIKGQAALREIPFELLAQGFAFLIGGLFLKVNCQPSC